MKKNLRLLCLGLAAATFTCGFAQEAQNMTDKLTNADMEQGLKGWAFDGSQLMGKNTKNLSVRTGFYGMGNGVLEAWNSNLSGLGDSYIMQRLSGLPEGTYVFGAYVGAALQGDSVSNRESIEGVSLFANDATVRVATDNPDMNGSEAQWAHTAKFNVAVTLTADSEKPGYMDAGLRYVGTNANYVVWDNATLYYFGNMSEADALDAMARIDVDNAIAIADTLKEEYMNADTLAALTQALDAAAAATVTAANLEEVSNPIFWNAGLARKSIADYELLKKNIESAKVAAAGEWSENNADYVALLNDAIAAAEKAYGEKAMDRAALTALRKELNWSAGDVKIDSVYTVQEVLSTFISEAKDVQGILYSAMQVASLEELADEISDTIGVYEADFELPMADRTVNPNNLYPYIARVEAAIENVKNNQMSADYTEMPIEFGSDADGYVEGAVLYDEANLILAYESPVYRFKNKVETFRITVHKAQHGGKYFCLSGLEFFDVQGNKIPLDETHLSTNADHVGNHPEDEGPEGNGIPALFDNDNQTFFHSEWKNSVASDHYLEITLPNGGYDVFSFRMLGRGNYNGHDQRRTFPGEMTLSTPTPKREALQISLSRAQALNAYSAPEPGFYNADFSYVLDAIRKVETALEGYPSEDECKAMDDELKAVIARFEMAEDKSIRVPEAGKKYRLISAVPGFANNQGLEKALTVHAADTTLWWETVSLDSLQQVFVFEPIMQDGEPFIKTEEGLNDDGTTWTKDYYCYTMKNEAYNLYVDSTFTGDPSRLHLVKEAVDTVMLYSLGGGQWNVIVKGNVLHAGDHNSGSYSEAEGNYGGIYGVSSGICSYGGEMNSASAWFIREMSAVPVTVTGSGDKFKSEFIHFESANTITLTADKNCAFTDLALYDLYGNAIAIDSLVVSGKTAKITATGKNLVGCAFEFTNAEGVSSVEFNAYEFIASLTRLQEAYDKAVAVAPEEGTEVGQYADVTEYNAAIEAAETMLAAGASDEEMDAMVERLDNALKGLKVNMPEAGKYYFIYNAVTAFEERNGYKMAMYTSGSELRWGNENYTDNSRYWQFEPLTKDDLKKHNADTTLCAYYIKNVANEMYIGDGATSSAVAMSTVADQALPYVVTVLAGTEVALDGLGQSAKRIHANGHGGGAGKGSNIVYWSTGAGSASAWHIVETQYDVTDIDFSVVENDAKVSAKGTFDLFGRRVVAPTAPGIYIIDGKKKYVK